MKDKKRAYELELAQANYRINAASKAASNDLYQCYLLTAGQKTPDFAFVSDVTNGIRSAFMLMTLGRIDLAQYHQIVCDLRELSERFDPAQYALVI